MEGYISFEQLADLWVSKAKLNPNICIFSLCEVYSQKISNMKWDKSKEGILLLQKSSSEF